MRTLRLKNKSTNKENNMKIAVAGTAYEGLLIATLLSLHNEDEQMIKVM